MKSIPSLKCIHLHKVCSKQIIQQGTLPCDITKTVLKRF